MTPLAATFAKQLTLPTKRRLPLLETGNAMSAFNGIHCFDCSDLMGLVNGMAIDQRRNLLDGVTFLPAPKTWVEWKDPDGYRSACLLCENEDKHSADAYVFFRSRSGGLVARWIGAVRLNGGIETRTNDDEARETAEKVIAFTLLFVAFINTPRVIGRKQHMPNRGLERRLVQGFGVGKFPLHAWTEIKLEVAKPPEIDDGDPHEAHLTGKRALHFCRAHIRIRNGKLEYVTHHWRGDPAIGIKQSRYKLVA